MYLKEFKLNWHILLACALGFALGSPLSHYTLSLFGPELIKEFGWSKADFALVGSVTLITLPLIPVAGRFADRFGPRVSAMVGFSAIPLGFLAYTMMTGSIVQFFAIYLAQHVFGILTTSMVFARVIVERFDAGRGLALSLLMTGPPAVGAIAAILIGKLIAAEGWRAGYYAMAFAAVAGLVITIPFLRGPAERLAVRPKAPTLPLREFLGLLRQPALLLIIGGMILVNLPQSFASSQLKLVVMDSGITDAQATWMVSLYAIGVIVGRFFCGLALDRIPAHIVAICTLGLPAIGFGVLASHWDVYWLLAGAVALIGMAQGAEGDVGAYLVSRKFDMKNYSLLLSLVTASIGLGAAIGGLVLSFTLRATDSYNSFLVVSALATVLGAMLFFATGRTGSAEPETKPVGEPA